MNVYRKFLFIVSLSLFSGLFSSHAQSAVLYSDNFELGLGNWVNVTTGDNRDWMRDSAGTSSVGTGPSTGAASAYYVYLETSSGYAYTAGDTAILQGPSITGTDIHLIFQYHMYGANIGTLAVDVYSGGSWINNVWSISGQQHISNSAAYTTVDVDLSSYAVSQIRLRATAAGGYTGDMAIDNIQITSTPTGPVAPVFNSNPVVKSDATQDQVYSDSIATDATDANGDSLTFSKVSGPAWLSVATNGQLSGTPQASDVGLNTFVVAVSDGAFSNSATLNVNVNDDSVPVVLFSDNFELGLGNWANVSVGDNNSWTRDSAGTPSVGTGPSAGADGSNYYMYLETSSGAAFYAGDSAILQGPSITDSNIHLAFKYHMYGTNTGTLAVDVLSSGSWINNVWSISGQQQTSNSAAYTAVDVDLSSYDITQVRIRATAAGGFTGDIALDDLEISMHLNPNDNDSDGVANAIDQCPNTPLNETADSAGCSPSQKDSDNDGVLDSNDPFPLDPNEWLDTDGDLIGNNADTDDDGDGVLDINDAFPLNSAESVDTDGDLIGNNADTDDDNDGVLDSNDAYPLISLGGLTDTDGDGIPNDCDASCLALGMLADSDDDADGVLDINDAFPLNSAESVDTDGDLIGNNADTDDDNDGVLDINDAYPLITIGTLIDTDGDGIPNDCDATCLALGMQADSDDDNDGVSDALDAFPLNPAESVDTDGDLIGNNADTDDDNDGVLDINDPFPLDSTEWLDTDSDSVGNNTDIDDDNDSLTDEDEINIHQTNPLSADSDLDGMNDGWEVLYSLLPNVNDADEDADNDGYTNLQEFNASTDPTDPSSKPYVPIDALSLGNNSSCALIKGEITCWGSVVQYPVPANLTAPEQIGHDGTDEFCALQGNDVTCWGYGSSMITDLQSAPVNNAVSLHVTPLANTACVITLSGDIKCWGSASYGINVPPASLINVKQMDMFQFHACGHDGTTVACWGRNTLNQTDVPVDLGVPVQVVVGGLHTCVLQDNQQVRCWGDNSKSQTNVPVNLGKVVSLDSGYYHTCALNDLGKVNCWGDNSFADQLNVPGGLSGVTKLHSGPYNNCAETADGAECWGKNDYGQSSIWYDLVDYGVGDNHVCGLNNDKVMCFGSTINEPEAVNIPAGISGPKAIGVGRYHSCVWADTGMHCWGKAGTHLSYPAGLTNVTEIDAQASHTCAIDDGTVVCWGANYNGVLNVPSNIIQPRELTTGDDHNCVLDGETTARCWGANYRGQSSDGYNLSNPVTITTGGIGAYPHVEDDGHSCVAIDSGVQCWGSSARGVLNVPPGLTNVIDLHAGWGSTCALEANGTVSCWGNLISQSNVDALNIGNVTKIKGYNSGICAESERQLSCSDGLGGALLINR